MNFKVAYPKAIYAGVPASEVISAFRAAERLHLRAHPGDHSGADEAGALAVAVRMCDALRPLPVPPRMCDALRPLPVPPRVHTWVAERDAHKAKIREAWAELDGIPNNNDPCSAAEAFRKDVKVMGLRLEAAIKLLGLLAGEEVPR